MSQENLRARKKIGCPFCSQIRFTKMGLTEHIKLMHPQNISPSGILIISDKRTPIMPEISQELKKRKGYNS